MVVPNADPQSAVASLVIVAALTLAIFTELEPIVGLSVISSVGAAYGVSRWRTRRRGGPEEGE